MPITVPSALFVSAFDGKKLYVITTAFDPGSQTGKFDKLENLAIFQPYLYAIAADLRLPW